MLKTSGVTADVSHKGGAQRQEPATGRPRCQAPKYSYRVISGIARAAESALGPASQGRQAGGTRGLKGRPPAKGAGGSRRSLAHPVRILLLHTVPTHCDAGNWKSTPLLPGRRNLVRANRGCRMRPKYSTLE